MSVSSDPDVQVFEVSGDDVASIIEGIQEIIGGLAADLGAESEPQADLNDPIVQDALVNTARMLVNGLAYFAAQVQSGDNAGALVALTWVHQGVAALDATLATCNDPTVEKFFDENFGPEVEWPQETVTSAVEYAQQKEQDFFRWLASDPEYVNALLSALDAAYSV